MCKLKKAYNESPTTQQQSSQIADPNPDKQTLLPADQSQNFYQC